MSSFSAHVGSWPIFVTVWIIVIIQIIGILMMAGVIPSEISKTTTESESCSKTEITSDIYGTLSDGRDVMRYKLTNSKGTRLDVITLGGIMTELWVPDRNGKLDDILLTYKDLETLEKKMNATSSYPYFGSLVGRYANRISESKFTVDGETYNLPNNNNGNTLHGGPDGWSHRIWDATIEDDHLRLDLVSPDGDNGFPGAVHVTVTYAITEDDALVIKWKATVTEKNTPINPTSHGYFNLAGEGSGTIHGQKVIVFADEFVTTDPDLIPLGNLSSVEGTGFDIRTEMTWGDAIPRVKNSEGVEGLDVCYKLKGPEGLRYGARVEDPISGRVMKVYTDQVGLQVYTSNYLDTPAGEGKQGHAYPQHAGFCMETQNFPDAVNNPTFPDSVLQQGSEYRQTVMYKFSTVNVPSLSWM